MAEHTYDCAMVSGIETTCSCGASSTPPKDTPTPAELAMWLREQARRRRDYAEYVAQAPTRDTMAEQFDLCADALMRLSQAEQERDASDAVHERLRQAAHKLALYSMPPSDLTLSMSWGIERRKRQDELDAALSAFCVDFDERHKRSR